MPLPRPFLVLATENPIELEGTFPLPEAQLDRFLMRLAIGYPDEADEVADPRPLRRGPTRSPTCSRSPRPPILLAAAPRRPRRHISRRPARAT